MCCIPVSYHAQLLVMTCFFDLFVVPLLIKIKLYNCTLLNIPSLFFNILQLNRWRKRQQKGSWTLGISCGSRRIRTLVIIILHGFWFSTPVVRIPRQLTGVNIRWISVIPLIFLNDRFFRRSVFFQCLCPREFTIWVCQIHLPGKTGSSSLLPRACSIAKAVAGHLKYKTSRKRNSLHITKI